MPISLSAEAVERLVTGSFGRACRFVDEVGSTNDAALQWAQAGAAEGTVVVAGHQTAGRGRWGRDWVSPPGTNLLFSVVLRPRFDPPQLGLLTTALGVGTAAGIERATGLGARIKWPNDIVVDERKIAGILTESRLSGGDVEVVVAGIGLNLAWTADEIPEELRGGATSVAIALEGRALPSAPEMLATVLDDLAEAYDLLTAAPDEVLARAKARSSVLGREVVVARADGSMVEGRARAIGSGGALEVETSEGRVTVTAGEVRSLRPR